MDPNFSKMKEALLREEGEFYTRANPFVIGDLVTPRKNSSTSGAGETHLVIVVLDHLDLDITFTGEFGSSSFGKRLDMRVLRWGNGRYHAFWVESAEFERWTTPAREDNDFLNRRSA